MQYIAELTSLVYKAYKQKRATVAELSLCYRRRDESEITVILYLMRA